MFGRQQDVEGQCNAWLLIPDDYGDNESTCRCQLPLGHEGDHCEEWTRRGSPVRVTWKVDEKPEIHAREQFEEGCDAAHGEEAVPESPDEHYLEGFVYELLEREKCET